MASCAHAVLASLAPVTRRTLNAALGPLAFDEGITWSEDEAGFALGARVVVVAFHASVLHAALAGVIFLVQPESVHAQIAQGTLGFLATLAKRHLANSAHFLVYEIEGLGVVDSKRSIHCVVALAAGFRPEIERGETQRDNDGDAAEASQASGFEVNGLCAKNSGPPDVTLVLVLNRF